MLFPQLSFCWDHIEAFVLVSSLHERPVWALMMLFLLLAAVDTVANLAYIQVS